MSAYFEFPSFNKRPLTQPANPTPLGFDIGFPERAVDNDTNSFTSHPSSTEGTAAGTEIDYVFTNPLGNLSDAIYIEKIVFKKDRSDTGRVTINDTEFEDNWSNTGQYASVTVEVEQVFFSFPKLSLFLETKGSTIAEAKLYNVQIHGETRTGQVDLRSLSASGDLTVSLVNPNNNSPASEDSNSNGTPPLFDGVFGQNKPKLVLNNASAIPDGSPKEYVTLNFNNPIKAQEIRLDLIHNGTTSYNIYTNLDIVSSNAVFVKKLEKTVPFTANPTRRQHNFNFKSIAGTEIRNIVFELGTSNNVNLYDHAIWEIELFVNKPIEPNFDFNDTVLTTKGWNSSRYDGRQLSAARRNQFTPGDVTYGKTPVVERYTRNIYIGNKVVDLNEGTVDSNFLPFNNFSYVQTNYYITINEDGSITHNRLKPTTTRTTQKIGFYQSFFDDFPTDKGCRLIIYDPKVKNNLKSIYPIYFNGGQFQQILKYQPSLISGFEDNYDVSYSRSSNILTLFAEGSIAANTGIRASAVLLNIPLLREIFSGDFVKGIQESTIATGNLLAPGNVQADGFYSDLNAFKTGSSYRNDRRYYFSLCSGSSHNPLRTIATGSIPAASDTIYPTQNLAELSTFEYVSASYDSNVQLGRSLFLHASNRSKLNFDYDSASSPRTPEFFESGSVILSKVSDDVPSLLLNLDASVELPDGIGDRPFIIVPENLHPYVEDNLVFYLSKAGINVSREATKTVVEITAKKPRKPRLTPGVRKAIVRGRRRRFQSEEESNRDRRQRERQNRRKKRKQNREDRKENRQENRQKRRENRQERRENRRENRQDRRQNRRNRRRNR
jgi:hypothetical protein